MTALTKAQFTFTDSHCHLDFDEFDANRAQLLNECAAVGIRKIIVPTIGPQNWQKVLLLCANTSVFNAEVKLFPGLGFHPWFLDTLDETHLAELSALVTHNKAVIAIGETGIDGVIASEQDNLIKQIQFFDVQINLAQQVALPLIIHHRRSHPQIVQRLKQANYHGGGVIHAFSGSYQEAKQYLDLGFMLGIGGTITYARAAKTLKTVSRIPLDAMVLETDAPAMPLYGHQGQANTPLRITEVFAHLCQIRSESNALIARQLEINASKLFRLTD